MKGGTHLAFFVLVLAAPTASAFEFGLEESVDAGAVEATVETSAALAPSAEAVQGSEEFVQVEWLVSAEVVLAQFEGMEPIAPVMDLVFTAPLPFIEAVEPAAEASDEVRAGASDAWYEGIGAEARGSASEDEVEVSYSAHLGSVQASGSQSTAVPKVDDLRARSYSGRSPTSESMQATAPSEPVAEPAAIDLYDSSQLDVGVFDVPPMVVAAMTVAIAGTAAGAAITFVPGWRSAATRILRSVGGFVLFSRIAQEEILNHERRNELLEFVKNNPGERVETARRSLGLPNGSMHYHLKVLRDRGLVRLVKQGSLARLYPAGPKFVVAPYVPESRQRLLEHVEGSPGLTQRELAHALSLSERMVSYHVKALRTQGLLEVQSLGTCRRLFARGATAS